MSQIISPEHYKRYNNGLCIEVWKEISFLNFSVISPEERKILDDIIIETLERIAFNVKVVFNVIVKHGFQYQNYGDLNSTGVSYSLKNPKSYKENITSFYPNIENELSPPLLFSAFCSFFDVIDFRGEFYGFNREILLDPLFIQSFKNFNETKELMFEDVVDDMYVNCCMFSPDPNMKEAISGSAGPYIIFSDVHTVDNYILNYTSDFKLTFIEYLRFCFHWSCFPNLYWAPDSEKEKFESILHEVRSKIKVF